ncbi:MAG TPA: magnesium transporter CorA family protein, partial [Dehalococcoidia bacterium]|nr:magnesium transporter CorA family protein [Dehalococcoidia bacterium]
GDLTWVDITEPTKEATNYLAEHYNFHPMDLEDSLSTRQLSKIEEYPKYLFIIFHFQVYEKITRISTRKQWSAFVGDTFLVTLHPVELKIIDDMFRECELNEETGQEYLSRGSGYVLYQIMDRLLDSYFPVLDKIASALSNIEDNVFSEELEAAHELSILRRDIITQRQIMLPTRTLLIELENKLKRFTKVDLTVYYSDLMDHMNKICQSLDEDREVVEVFKDADFILSSYRANRGIRVISVMLAIGLPLLAVFGLYGIYSILYGSVNKSSPQIFFMLLAIVLAIVGVILYFFRRRHLI